MDDDAPLKDLVWVGSSKRAFREFPEAVKDDMGYALFRAQEGKEHPSAKALQGFTGRGILEVVEHHDGNTYRAVYTVKFSSGIYVLHAFQKKSKKGIATPKQELDLMKKRLKDAEILHEARSKKESK